MNSEPISTSTPKKLSSHHQTWQWLWLFVIVLSLSYGFFLRIEGLQERGLEYDEIWSLHHYASRTSVSDIFTDLGTPNNHPLHSLAIRWSVSLFGESALALRLPAFLAGAALAVIAGLIIQLLFHYPPATALTVGFTSFSGPLIHFSRTARGYSLQLLFLALFLLFLLLYQQHPKHKEPSSPAIKLLPAAGSVWAIAAVLTLPTSILYLAPIMAAHVYTISAPVLTVSLLRPHRFKKFFKEHQAPLAAHTIIAIFCLLWYSFNYHQFRQAQEFGTVIPNLVAWLRFTHEILTDLTFWPWLLLPLLGLIDQRVRQYTYLAFALAAVPLISAVMTQAGPSRAYLPILLYPALGGGVAIMACRELCRRHGLRDWLLPAGVCVLILSAALRAETEMRHHTPIDWRQAGEVFSTNFNRDVYLNFPASDGYALLHNLYPEILTDRFQRALHLDNYLIQVAAPGKISGVNAHGRGREQQVKGYSGQNRFQYAGIECDIYTLDETTPRKPRQNTLAVIGPLEPTRARRAAAILMRMSTEGEEWICLNPWLTAPLEHPEDGKSRLIKVLFSNSASLSPQTEAALRQAAGNKVKFRKLVPMNE